VAAWWSIVSERPDIVPEHDLRCIISSYNTAVGGINDDPQGDHETITRSFIHAVRLHLATMVDASLTDQVNALSRSRLGRRDWPLQFFTANACFRSLRARISSRLISRRFRNSVIDRRPWSVGTGVFDERTAAMGMLDGLLGQLGENVDVANLATKVGLSQDQVETAMTALGQAHGAPGDTVATAAESTGMSGDVLQQIVTHIGGEGSLGRFADLLGSGGGEGGGLGSLAGLASGFLGGTKS